MDNIVLYKKISIGILGVNVHFQTVSPILFSQTVEYALRAMVHLAAQTPAACTTDQIAEVTLVPRAYLSKVLQSLRNAGLVHTQRGVKGGMTLALPPAEITILQVVNAVDPIQRIHTCPLGLEAHGVHLCPLHSRVDEALAMVEAAFQNSTLAEILSEPTRSVPLGAIPGLCTPAIAAERSCTLQTELQTERETERNRLDQNNCAGSAERAESTDDS